jgi:hypothetical protein
MCQECSRDTNAYTVCTGQQHGAQDVVTIACHAMLRPACSTGQFMSGLTDGLVLDISATKPVKQGTGTSLLPASSAAQSDGSGDDSPPAPAAAPAKKGGRRGSRKTAAASSAAAGVGVAAAGGDVKEEITLVRVRA